MRQKKIFVYMLALLVTVSFVFGTQAQSPVKESLLKFDKLASSLTVNSVIGKPVRSGSSVVIPFARIKFGLGAGGTLMGYGGGMGGKVIPAGLLIIENGEARVELFPLEEKKPSMLEQLLPLLLKNLPNLMGNKFPGGSKPAKVPGGNKTAALTKDVTLEKVKSLFEQKKYTDALVSVDVLLAKEPESAEYHAWKGNIMGSLAGSGNPVDMMKYGMGAIQEFEKAVKLDPKNVTARFGRGMSRLMAPKGFGQNIDGAIEDFEFACRTKPEAESFYYLGQAYKGKGLLRKAAEAYKKALSLKPDYKDAAKALSNIK